MSEEIKKPALNVPRAMMAAVAINGALGLSMLIVQLLYLGDPDSLFATPYATALNFPYIALFQRIVGANAGAVTMVALVFVLVMCAAVSCIATASRLTWAFARDRGLPGWSIWSRVERRTTVPLFSVALVAMAAVGLSLIGFGSAIAFNIMISLTVAHLYTSYFIGNALLLYRRIAGQIEPYSPDETDIVNTIGAARLTWGPWKVPGVLGIINNIVGCIFLLVVLFFSFFPTVNNPTPQTMNWSVLLAVGIASLALVYYIIVGRKTFKGPIVETVGDGY